MAILLLLPLLIYLIYGPLPALLRKYWTREKLRQETDKPQLVLTFDDGPDSRYTQEILAVLARYQVKAVFFLVGNKALKQHKIVTQILAEGHQLGFHSMQHKNGLLVGPFSQKKDFFHWQAIAQSYHWPISYYRPPWGLANISAMYYAHKFHYPVLYWSVIVGDWDKRHSGEELCNRLLSQVHNGAVICLHDSGEGTGGDTDAAANTVAALEKFIPMMQRVGYEFVLPKEVIR